MSNQILISSGAKLRDLDDVIIGTDGVLSSLAFNVANGVPKLDENGKILVSQLPNSVMEFKGVWNAATNTPTLANGTGNAGDVYLCNVAGTVNFGAGPIAFAVGDYAVYTGTVWARSSGATGTVTSVGVSRDGNALAITGSPITTSGTINLGFSGDNTQYINGAGNLTTFPTLITSIGLTMPAAFNVSNSPLTSNGTIGVTGAGTASQYIRGDGQLATFPTTGGGGSAIYYYLNGSIASSVAGYEQMANTAVVGAGTDFNKVGNGLIAQFLTDIGNPNRNLIPSGAWNFEVFFSSSSNGGLEKFYLELVKYNGSTFTTIASTVTNPEAITGGTTTDLYITSMAVPETTLLVTDRLAIRVYIVDNSAARTVTLHTEDNNLCQITTTFSAGISSINGLTENTQYLAVGTSGSDFNIVSSVDTHTFNLPTASATKRGALSSADWSTFNGKQDFITAGTTLQYFRGDKTFQTLNTSVVPELTNLYFTDARAREAISLTTTGSSGASTYSNITGILNVPNYTLAGLGGVPTSRTLTINGVTYDLSADRTWTITSGISSVSGTAPISVSTVGGAATVSIATANTTTTGALTSTDWNTFNGKQNALTLTTTGSSGAATLVGSILNIPNYGSALSGYVPYTGATANVNLGTNDLLAKIGFFTNGQTYSTYISADSAGGYVQAYRLSDTTYHPFTIYAGTNTTAYKTFVLNNTGATLNTALNGTSANFTSSVNGLNYTMGNWNTINYTASIMQIGGISASQWQQIDFYTAGTLRATINSDGVTNFFRSVTTTSFFQTIGSGTYLRAGGYIWAGGSGGDYGSVGYNIGYNSTTAGSYTYVVNDFASMVRFESGGFRFLTAPVGAIGAAIGFTSSVIFANGGNVLIGTDTNAGFRLDVNGGPVRFSGSLTIGSTFIANTGTGATFRAIYNGDNNVEIGNYSAASGYRELDIVGSVIKLGTGTAGTGSFTNRLTISATGVSTFSNVVIVNAQLSSNSFVFRNSSGANDIGFLGSRSDWTGGPANLEMAIGSYRPSITFFTNNSTTERMRLTAVGRLGLGTDNPFSLLHIYGADPFLRIANSLAGDQGIKITYLNDDTSSLNLLYNPNVATAYIENTYAQSAGQPWGDIHIRQSIGGTMTTRMLFKNIANSIYIGTTTGVSGGGTLQVNGNVNINGVFQINGTTIGGGGGSGVTGSGTTNYVTKWTGGSTLGNGIMFDNGSCVSINSTNPTFGGFDPTFLVRQKADGDWNGINIEQSGNDAILNIGYRTSSDAFTLGTSYRNTGAYKDILINPQSAIFRFKTNGNLLIGTNTDNGYRLQISGSVSSTGGYFDTSDARLKTLIEDNYLLSSIANVKAKLYIKDGRKELGYYAQGIQEILPSAVSEGADGFLSLSYAQVHTAKIAVIEDEVTVLKNRVSELETKIQKYEA